MEGKKGNRKVQKKVSQIFAHGNPVNEWTPDNVRSVVLELLQEMTQTELSIISPLPQSMISNIINSKYKATMSVKTLQAFGDWYTEYRNHKPVQHTVSKAPNARLTFHVQKEVPKMKVWFTTNMNPCERQLEEYVNELNTSVVRLERPKVTVEKLRNWFKNERQKLKRKRDKQCESQLDRLNSGEINMQTVPDNKQNEGSPVRSSTTKVTFKSQSDMVSQSNLHQVQGHCHRHQTEGHFHGCQIEGGFHTQQSEGQISWCDGRIVWSGGFLHPKPP